MSEVSWVHALNSEAERLQRVPAALGLHDLAAKVQLRLAAAATALAAGEHDVLRIALWGGTGTGKSSLFNALSGMPDCEGVSNSKRPFTTQPRIAASQSDLPLVADWGEAVFELPDGLPTLVDCPDVDSVEKANGEVAEKCVERSDIVLLVATPDKRANFDIAVNVRRWASRKRWFFVMNKADRLADDEFETARQDFCGRIRDLGFAVKSDHIFVVSTKQRSHDYERMRQMLFGQRAVQRVRALAQEHAMKRLLYAFDTRLWEPLTEAKGVLEEAHKKLHMETQKAYERALSASSREVLGSMKRERIWQKLAGRVHGSMALAVGIRARLGHFFAALSSGFLLSRGRGMAAIIRMLWSSIASIVSRRYTLRQLTAGQGNELKNDLLEISDRSRRAVEDAKVHIGGAATSNDADRPIDEASGREEARLRAGLRLLGITFPKSKESDQDGDFSEMLNDALEASAIQTSNRFPWFLALMANVLPLVILGDFVWRLGNAWYGSPPQYLELAYFANFAVLFLLAHLPGYLLVAAWVGYQCRETSDMVTSIAGQMSVPGPLRGVLERVDRGLQEVEAFRAKVKGWISAMGAELSPDSFGATGCEED